MQPNCAAVSPTRRVRHNGVSSALPLVGVLGGMGPAATSDFYAKLIAATPAGRDQDHLPVLIHAVPQIPDRSDAFMNGGPSPQATLERFARKLQADGVAFIVIPCNTAHLWHLAISRSVQVPVLHMVDPLIDALQAHFPIGSRVRTIGLLATTATLRSQLYPDRASALSAALNWVAPDDGEQERLVTRGIMAVKAARFDEARECLSQAAHRLVARGAEALVYACSEIPIVLPMRIAEVPAFDPTQLLARETVRRAIALCGLAVPRFVAIRHGLGGGSRDDTDTSVPWPSEAGGDPCI
jgi:aspartate racemase